MARPIRYGSSLGKVPRRITRSRSIAAFFEGIARWSRKLARRTQRDGDPSRRQSHLASADDDDPVQDARVRHLARIRLPRRTFASLLLGAWRDLRIRADIFVWSHLISGLHIQGGRASEKITRDQVTHTDVSTPKCRVAQTARALRLPLHPLVLLAQRRGGLLRQAVQAAIKTRGLPICRRSPSRHQPLPRRDKSNTKALHMDRRPRQNHRSRQTGASSVRFSPLPAFSPDLVA